MKSLSIVDWIAVVLVIVGGVNWGLVGLFNVDLVATLFGDQSMLASIVYILVGVAALWMIYTVSKMRGSSTPEKAGPSDMPQEPPM